MDRIIDRGLMVPMTADEADAAYDAATAIPMSSDEIAAIVVKVTAKGCVGKYRKKPVVIEAVQWDGRNWDEVMPWCSTVREARGTAIAIPTLEGDMLANVGDWIIKGINGEFYPCKPDIFEKTYDAAF